MPKRSLFSNTLLCCGIILLNTVNIYYFHRSIKNWLAGSQARSIGGTTKLRMMGGRRAELPEDIEGARQGWKTGKAMSHMEMHRLTEID